MNTEKDPYINILRLNKESGYAYKERRMDDWKENYTLYRDRVKVNRLTQRQSVNIPLMKQTIRTLLKDVDDMPVLYFENLNNDKQKEVFQNEYWKRTVEDNRMDLKDIQDKRQVFLTGRSFDQIQIENGKVIFTIQDVDDIFIDRYTDPVDIDTARFLIHTHIFKPLSVLMSNDMYDKEALKKLAEYRKTPEGILHNATSSESLNKKNEKMRDMGLDDVNDPMVGEMIIELSMHLMYYKDADSNHEEQLHLFVEADDMFVIMKKPLEQIIGKTKDDFWQTHFPYNTWADDIDRQDFWTDGVADIVRTPNKILNAWFSQLVENRTLKNLNMNIFNSSLEGFVPQTWEPRAWGMYGIPVPDGKNIGDVFQQLPVADLSDSLDELSYVVGMIEKATGATATQQGAQTERQITLGEVQLALGEAKERIKGMSKFYTPAWKDRGRKFLKLIEAAPEKLDAVKIYKKGLNTDNVFESEIQPSDWMSEAGYDVKVWAQDEKTAQDTQGLEKMNAAVANIPGNIKLMEIFQRKLLEYADLTPDEVNAVIEIEKQKQEAFMQQQQLLGQGAPQPGQPPQGQLGQPQQAPAPVA